MKWHEDENEELGIGENTFREECRGLSGVITWVIVHLPPSPHPWSRVETNRRPPLPFFLG